jgi:predicted PurR-regulated permease PerM
MEPKFKIPFYAKMALVSVGLFSFVYTLFLAQQIIIPVVFGTIIAILLNPFVNFLMGKKINKIVSISIAVFLVIIIVCSILYIVSSQVTMFSETFPQLKAKFNTSTNELTHWVSNKFNIKISKINAWSKETQIEALDNFELGERLTEVGSVLVTLMLLPAYLFMILYYKPLLLDFIRKVFGAEHKLAVEEVLLKSKTIIQTYLIGLFFEMMIVATLSSIGLLILGIDYAIIIAITGAILNIIPYIGGIVAIALPMIIAFVTKESSSYAIGVFFVYVFIQFIDNHYIIPKIVASRVQINALISVIVILIGGALWGIPGMFLSIPMTAIFKVIFDQIEPLKPWGLLLGNVVPTVDRIKARYATPKK